MLLKLLFRVFFLNETSYHTYNVHPSQPSYDVIIITVDYIIEITIFNTINYYTGIRTASILTKISINIPVYKNNNF